MAAEIRPRTERPRITSGAGYRTMLARPEAASTRQPHSGFHRGRLFADPDALARAIPDAVARLNHERQPKSSPILIRSATKMVCRARSVMRLRPWVRGRRDSRGVRGGA